MYVCMLTTTLVFLPCITARHVLTIGPGANTQQNVIVNKCQKNHNVLIIQ